MPPRLPAAAWLRALFATLALLLVAGVFAPARAAPAAPVAAGRTAVVRIITTSPVPAGKFVGLVEAGKPLGLAVEALYAERLTPQQLPGLWAGADLVLLDTPREHMEQAVRQQLGEALPLLVRTPHVWLGTEAPKPGGGVDAALAQRLHAYWVNGGKANRTALLRLLAAHTKGQSWQDLPPPVVLPKAGIYHPDLQQVLSDAGAYLAARGTTAQTRPPVVAIAFHQQAVSAEQTALVDALIARVEAGGALALPLYTSPMDSKSLAALLQVDGKPVADALISAQITLEVDARRAVFEQLGIPVLQALVYRRGGEADWRADPQGVTLNDVPFYLAQAETTGAIDPLVVAAVRAADQQEAPIAAQADALVHKALALARLARTAPADKRVALMVWNYPAGEKNLSASFLNLPRSLAGTLAALNGAGYRADTPSPEALTTAMQRLLAPSYRGGTELLRALLRDGLADRLPLARYEAWLASLPPPVRAALLAQGQPAQSRFVLDEGGERVFVVPRIALGHTIVLPQPSREDIAGAGDPAARERAVYHSTSALPGHHYLATYLWLREQYRADALVHYGTHGTQEWLPGKERGLATTDYPLLALGDVPVVYPYIVDNIGEALQAKRRGRAVTITHLTPPLVPAGLHRALTELHDELHQWLALEDGGVREQVRASFIAHAKAQRLHLDLGYDDARIAAEFPAFIDAVHTQLHEIARTAQPRGMHTFGQGAAEDARIATVLMMLGQPFWEATAGPGEEADEQLVGDHERLAQATPFRRLRAHLLEGQPIAGLPAPVAERLAQARTWFDGLSAEGEQRALLAALAGRYTPTSYGGDPIKAPDALPTGRNLYGFDPSRVPTAAAWAAGKQALDALLAAHTRQQGKAPTKLAFSLWSVETMRHLGLLEAQALWALGVEPVWDAGGRVESVRLIPREQLGRPRVDVVLSATGLYRDQFPNTMRQLAQAVKLAAQSPEADNPVAAHSAQVRQRLRARGLPDAVAEDAALTRLFASESGHYSSGLDSAALATDTWRSQAEGDRKLADLYLRKMQYGYGPDEARWGQALATAGGGNLYAEQLRGTDAAVLSRSSNLYGMLTTDDPFQYLGGLALAVRHLDGKAPALYISNLRGSGAGRVESAAAFMATELATRQFHPGYIKGLMAEGYGGTLEVLNAVNNFAGWQSVAREVVRGDQWQEFADVYVRDKHQLGLARWFEQHNPHALAQSIERMIEAARLGQWQADAATLAELKGRWRELARQHDVRSDNAAFNAVVMPAGFGLHAPATPARLRPPQPTPTPAAAAAPPPAAAPAAPPRPPPVRGLQLKRVADAAPLAPTQTLLALALLLAATGGGALHTWRGGRAIHLTPRTKATHVQLA